MVRVGSSVSNLSPFSGDARDTAAELTEMGHSSGGHARGCELMKFTTNLRRRGTALRLADPLAHD